MIRAGVYHAANVPDPVLMSKSMGRSLTEHFLAQVPEPVRAHYHSRPSLEQTLTRIVDDARTAWPGLSLSPEEFVEHLAARVAAAAGPDGAGGDLDDLCTRDLYLACAAENGDAAALAAFDATYFSGVAAAIAHLDPSRNLADDVKQLLRLKLFVATPGRKPKIAEFSGLGNLRSWLRVAAVRTAISLRRKTQRELPVDDDALMHVPSGDDQELGYLKAAYRSEFKIAFQQALDALTPRQRNLLRHQVIDRLSIDDIGAMYSVHRATAARWLAKAREALVKTTRKRLIDKLGVETEELDEIIALIESRLYGTLPKFLVETEE